MHTSCTGALHSSSVKVLLHIRDRHDSDLQRPIDVRRKRKNQRRLIEEYSTWALPPSLPPSHGVDRVEPACRAASSPLWESPVNDAQNAPPVYLNMFFKNRYNLRPCEAEGTPLKKVNGWIDRNLAALCAESLRNAYCCTLCERIGVEGLLHEYYTKVCILRLWHNSTTSLAGFRHPFSPNMKGPKNKRGR